jgi:hypothetical protein
VSCCAARVPRSGSSPIRRRLLAGTRWASLGAWHRTEQYVTNRTVSRLWPTEVPATVDAWLTQLCSALVISAGTWVHPEPPSRSLRTQNEETHDTAGGGSLHELSRAIRSADHQNAPRLLPLRTKQQCPDDRRHLVLDLSRSPSWRAASKADATVMAQQDHYAPCNVAARYVIVAHGLWPVPRTRCGHPAGNVEPAEGPRRGGRSKRSGERRDWHAS